MIVIIVIMMIVIVVVVIIVVASVNSSLRVVSLVPASAARALLICYTLGR